MYQYRTTPAMDSTPFTTHAYSLPLSEHAILAYERAEAAALTYEMTMDDLLSLSPKFWEMHQDPVTVVDGAAFTIMTIQYNLCAGTIARFALNRLDLIPLVEDLLRFRKHGQFLLTEVGHGLDISNLETTATLQPSGEFILHSPSRRSAKFMPPTLPAGRPCIAVVFARFIVNEEDYGIRPFVVPINDGTQMCKGVKAQVLPYRGGTDPVNHTITTFDNVELPSTSLLGSLEKPSSPKLALMQSTWRVAIGSMALGCLAIPMMKCYATIGSMYSLRRHVGPLGQTAPIWQFRTQQIPILTTTAQVYVTQAFCHWATSIFQDTNLDSRVRHGIATIFKAVMVHHSQSSALSVSERCGAQGLFLHNQINAAYGTMRGISIAEGDVTVLSIRLATELLQGRYAVPAAKDPTSLLARHELGLFEEKRAVLASCTHHRSEAVNRRILPSCQPLVEAIGHRMAYEAAVSEGVPRYLIDLYVSSVVKFDSAWYADYADFGRRAQEDMEMQALDAVLPHLGSLIRDMGMSSHITAPIVSDDRWDNFVDSLEVHEGNGDVELWPEFSGSGLRAMWAALPLVINYML